MDLALTAVRVTLDTPANVVTLTLTSVSMLLTIAVHIRAVLIHQEATAVSVQLDSRALTAAMTSTNVKSMAVTQMVNAPTITAATRVCAYLDMTPSMIVHHKRTSNATTTTIKGRCKLTQQSQ